FSIYFLLFFFFFQAEDGIRDRTVTGVQTCALPIWNRGTSKFNSLICQSPNVFLLKMRPLNHQAGTPALLKPFTSRLRNPARSPRSEERRVGKECRSRWAEDH